MRRVRMHDAADYGVLAVEGEVGRRIGGRAQRTLDDLAVEIDHHHVRGLHGFVADAARFDDDDALLTVDAADVAPGKGHQTVLGQIQVGAKNFFLQLLKCHESNLHICRWEKWLGLRCPVPDAGEKRTAPDTQRKIWILYLETLGFVCRLYAHYSLALQGIVQNFPFLLEESAVDMEYCAFVGAFLESLLP